jgi:hypothetical protein
MLFFMIQFNIYLLILVLFALLFLRWLLIFSPKTEPVSLRNLISFSKLAFFGDIISR